MEKSGVIGFGEEATEDGPTDRAGEDAGDCRALRALECWVCVSK